MPDNKSVFHDLDSFHIIFRGLTLIVNWSHLLSLFGEVFVRLVLVALFPARAPSGAAAASRDLVALLSTVRAASAVVPENRRMFLQRLGITVRKECKKENIFGNVKVLKQSYCSFDANVIIYYNPY